MRSDKQVRESFDRWLKNAIELGLCPPSDLGFYYNVERALFELADEYPNPTGAAITKARNAFAAQMDGTDAKESMARRREILARQGGTL